MPRRHLVSSLTKPESYDCTFGTIVSLFFSPTALLSGYMHFSLQAIILASAPLVYSAVADRGNSDLLPEVAQATNHRHILNPAVNAAIQRILKDFNCPGGVGVAVVHKSEQGSWVVETKGYGIAKADGTKATSDTLFAIGSNSQTKIASVVPEWGLMDPIASAESTIQDVMSHRTGLPLHNPIISLTDTVPEIIGRLRYLKPSAGFREQYQDENHMYTLLSFFPPLLTGIPSETYVNDFIIEPLGMSSTTYSFARADETGHLADGMARDGVNQTEDMFGLGHVRALPYWAPSNQDTGLVTPGEGGVISNANDMAIWLQTLLNQGQHPTTNEIIVPSEVIAQVSSGLTVAAPIAYFPELSPVVFGGAQRRGSYRGFEFIEHQVSALKSPGYPIAIFGVAVMSNDDSFGTQIVESIKFRIIDEALKLDAIYWPTRFKSLITAGFENRAIPTPRPTNPTLPLLPFDKLVGKYWDPGYGLLNLCLFSSRKESLASESCRELLAEIPTHLPDTIDPQIPTLLARWETIGLSYVSLAHFEGNVFNVSAFSSIPTGNYLDKPFWVRTIADPSFVAEFSQDENLGFSFRSVWGAGAGVESPQGDTVKERAEVWFEKKVGETC
ncbi:beta-lactamase/transpeptidase-like protein [Mycena crocata]|nr:beta-lactamase/transpeptidase-like protein [Mycena crocata]